VGLIDAEGARDRIDRAFGIAGQDRDLDAACLERRDGVLRVDIAPAAVLAALREVYGP